MTLYETLGIKPDATPEDIKRAYRVKAVEHHPDKGGDAQTFAEIAHAHDVLKDPQRRLLYDAGGGEEQRPIEQMARSSLSQLFQAALQNDGPVLAFCREMLAKAQREVESQRTQLTKRREKLLKRRDKVTTKSETNLFQALIDQEVRSIDGQLDALGRQTEIHDWCTAELQHYDEEMPAFIMVDQRAVRLDDLSSSGFVRFDIKYE